MERKIFWLLLVAVVAGAAYFGIEFARDDTDPGKGRVTEPEIATVADPKAERAAERLPRPEENVTPQQPTVPAELGEDRKIRGRVTDMDGQAIADANITLFTFEVLRAPALGDVRPRHREIVRTKVKAGSDGRYEIDGLDDVQTRMFTLRFEAEGYSELLKDAVGPGMYVDAKLERGIPLDLRVIDADSHEGVVDALIDIGMSATGDDMHSYRRWRREYRTDAEGWVRLQGVPTARLTMLIDHPDYQWLYVKPEDEVWAQVDRRELVFELRRGVTLDGVVVDARSQAPIDDCLVTLREFIIASRREKTGVFGKFKLKGLNRGSVEINFEADGYTRHRELLEISDEGMREPRVFQLQPAGMASGTVVDDTGQPIVGADVWVAEARGVFRAIRGDVEATTDRDGVYSVRNLDHDLPYRIVARAPGYTLGNSAEFLGRSGEFVDGVIVQLQRGAEIQGLVTDEGGVPVAGAIVTIERPPFPEAWFPPDMEEGQKSTLSLVTDEVGYWKIDGLWPGPYQITVDHADYIPMLPEEIRITVGNERLEKNFKLLPGHAIEGRVVDGEGRPVAGVEVKGSIGAFQARSSSTRTDGEGRYRLARLLHRPYRVKAIGRDGVAEEKFDVQVDTSGVDFRLQPYGSVEGVVLAYEGGLPIERFEVKLLPLMALPEADDGRRSDERLNLKTMTSHEAYVERTIVAPDGRFRIEGVHPGSYRVEVSADDRVSLSQQPVTVNPASIGSAQPFVLRAGAAFQGRVTDSDDKPIGGQELTIRIVPTPNSTLETTVGPDGQPVLQRGRTPWEARNVKIDGDGRFHSGGLPAGILRVQLSSNVFCCPPWQDFTFGKDGTIEKNYVLRRAAHLVLMVKDQFGNPVDLPSAQVYDPEGEVAKVDDRALGGRGDPQGKLEIPKLEPGRYTVELSRYQYAVTRVEVELAEGEQLSLDVEMEKLVR
ncbi:MAG: carboxypeptidase regulatory-like domain-containing protein [Planctomycetes bacterium]|nr:carboxypeptidase regulatory-like domain-containing protein [Planctomycetota bacterium]